MFKTQVQSSRPLTPKNTAQEIPGARLCPQLRIPGVFSTKTASLPGALLSRQVLPMLWPRHADSALGSERGGSSFGNAVGLKVHDRTNHQKNDHDTKQKDTFQPRGTKETHTHMHTHAQFSSYFSLANRGQQKGSLLNAQQIFKNAETHLRLM